MAFETCPGNFGFFGMGYGWIFQIIILVVFFIIMFWLFRNNGIEKNKSPLEILKQRLAKGEITKKQFEELKKEIE